MPSLYDNYFADRNAVSAVAGAPHLPGVLVACLPSDKAARILDLGCGHGNILRALKDLGYTNAQGVDVSPDAVLHCQQLGLNVSRIDSITDFVVPPEQRYEFIVMTHVLEHIPKAHIIPSLIHLRAALLSSSGSYYVAVPNAQSNTGCYWAYEDFTHETLFTAGSLYFVLKRAGFQEITFLDPEGLADCPSHLKFIKRLLLRYYRWRINFWNRVTSSSFHLPSERIFTFELKALARSNAGKESSAE